jgi:alkaline phosphatase D
MKKRWLAASLALLSGNASANGRFLQAGPMVGYSEPKEVLLWAQTNAPAKVKFAYWEEGKPAERRETAEQATLKQDGYIAKLVADEVEPGKRYEYELLIDGERVARPYPLRFQARPVFRGFRGPGGPPAAPPAAPTLRVATGSCYYANDPADAQGWNPGGEYHIFESIREKQPDLMLWLGDNVYTRDVDWTTRTGMLARYGFGRAVEGLQPLLGSVHHYAIWDDHDYGPNDADRSYRDKEMARDVFRLFWGNPAYGVPGREGTRGVNYRFTWADVEFFLLDNRWNRSPNMRIGGKRQVLGEEQIEWLLDSLASSNAAFKIVVMGGQVLNPARVAETYANYPEEREELLRRLAVERVRGVFFLTGDRHFTDLTKLERKASYPLYDFTVSPLTVAPANGEREANSLRVPGSYVQERNFATLDFKGPFGGRELVLSVWSSRGELKWTRSIPQRELREPEE